MIGIAGRFTKLPGSTQAFFEGVHPALEETAKPRQCNVQAQRKVAAESREIGMSENRVFPLRVIETLRHVRIWDFLQLRIMWVADEPANRVRFLRRLR